MEKDGVDFRMVEGGNFEISTSKTFDEKTFVTRIVSVAVQKTNFKMQAEFLQREIEEKKKMIEMANENYKAAEADLDRAFTFLHKVHREDLVTLITAEVNKKQEEYEQQMKQQPQN